MQSAARWEVWLVLTLMNIIRMCCQFLGGIASFPGYRRNGLATSAGSNCIRMLHHGNCSLLVHMIQFFQLWEWGFPARGSNCLRFVLLWSEIEVAQTKIVMQSAYTSAIEWSLLKWNGCDCDGSMHYAIGFYCCHVTTFWN